MMKGKTRHLIWRVLAASAVIVGIVALTAAQVDTGWAKYSVNPPVQPGFPQTLTGSNIYESSPKLADLDGNPSTLEIVIAGRDRSGDTPSCQGRVYAYRPNGTKYWETQVRAPVNSSPAIADVDRDGKPEVIVGLGGYVGTPCWHGGVVALNGQTGAVKWTFDTQDWLNHSPDGWLDGVYSSPAVGDVNGDGKLEIAFGAWDQCIYLLDGATGSPLWPELNGVPKQQHCGGHGFYNEDTIWSSPALADLTNDGRLEIVIGADISAGNQNGDPSGGYVYVLRHDGTILAREWLDQTIYSSPAVGDLDNDGRLEIVIGTGTWLAGKGYYVKVFNLDVSAGRLTHKYTLSTCGRVFSSPALADINGDGYLDIVAIAHIGDGPEQGGSNDGSRVFAWSGKTGQKLYDRPICDSFGNHYATHTSPVIAEVGRAGDVGLKTLFGHSWEVGIMNADGRAYTDMGECYSDEVTDLTYWANYSVFASPAVADIDGDGKVEVVIGGGYDDDNPNVGQLYVWEPGRSVGKLPWPQFRHDAYNTGNYCFTTDKPSNPTSFSATPSPGGWSNNNTISVSWTGASTSAQCGIGGYSFTWSTSPDTVPDRTVDTTGSSTTSGPLASGIWYFHLMARDAWGGWASEPVHLGPFKIDTSAPSSVAYSPRYAAGTNVPVQWTGSDVGSGIASYDVQVQVDGGVWQNWRTQVTSTSSSYSGAAGHTYCFRSRARDHAGNLEAWPATPDACTTVTAYMIAGRILNSSGGAVMAARISAVPAMVNTAVSEPDGSYALYFNSRGEYTLSIVRSGFGTLPPTCRSLSGSMDGVDFVLPPENNLVINGGFESGIAPWQSASFAALDLEEGLSVTSNAHTGEGALEFGASASAAQSFHIPQDSRRPALSIMYRVEGTVRTGDRFRIVARAANGEVSRDLPLDATQWSHTWLDVSSMVGRDVSVVLECVRSSQSSVRVIVDEVSLGEVRSGVYQSLIPTVLK
ncbi:MAG: hypothetical protein GX620_02785 [Chloroflexi bacterium]|nr:hypothetical protein [Chloroflexota bacterium]